MKRLAAAVATCVALSALGIAPAFAAIVISVDEFGDSVVSGIPGLVELPFAVLPDPGPGGLPMTLTYTLPFAPVVGDVTFVSPGDPGILFGGDVVRFNPPAPGTAFGTLVFYSDIIPSDLAEALADTPSPPGALYANIATAVEIGPEGDNRATYTPLAGQPGFFAVPGGITYVFASDARVPEPSTALLLGSGLAGLALFARKGFLRKA